MNDKVAITGLAMLQTMWETRHKDLLDLITPFVFYAIAQKTPPEGKVDIENTLEFVRSHYGYVDMPESVVSKILHRNVGTTFQKKDKSYYLVRDLGPEVERMEGRKKESEKFINEIGVHLSEYLAKHCKHKRRSRIDAQSAISHLHSFFKYYGLDLGIDRLEQVRGLTPDQNEIHYYIANYILERKRDKSAEYDMILKLVKGYFLQTAIYLQPENGNIVGAKLKDLEIYYDTPILLDLLGYHNDRAKDAALNLHRRLLEQKAKCYYFPYAEQEINGILHAYKRSLENNDFKRVTWNTLENLEHGNYPPSHIDVLLAKWESDLKSAKNRISEKEVPIYPVKRNGKIDEKLVLDEEKIKDLIRNRNGKYPNDNLDRDIESVAAIYKIRGGPVSEEIEKAKAIFVTKNKDLCEGVNDYCKKEFEKYRFPLVLLLPELASIIWLKSGSISDIPEKQLLMNAYSALQPTPEILNSFCETVDRLEMDGEFSMDVAIAVKTNRFIEREVWKKSLGEPDGVTRDSVLAAKRTYEDGLLEGARKKEIEDRNLLNKNVQESAAKRGDDWEKRIVKIADISITGFCIVLFVALTCITYISSGVVWPSLLEIVLLVLGISSNIDFVARVRDKLNEFIKRKISRIKSSVIEKERNHIINAMEGKSD